jgi:hypothetical protein
MLLCARAFALQNGQNLGWNYLPLCFAAQAAASGKTSYALQPHYPPSFWPFSPEAVLLTLWGKRELFHINIRN